MKKQEKTQFEDFLKNLYWQKNNTPEINPGIFSAKKRKEKRVKNSFNNILNKLENKESKDLDDFSAFLWQKHFQKHKNNFKKTKSRDFLNQELNPHAHIDIFLDETKKNIVKINFSPIIIIASAVMLAIVLTSSVIRFNPLFAKQIVATGDSLIINPIKITYCSLNDDILCQPRVNYIKDTIVKKKIDKNILSSYIINNQAKLKNINSNKVVQIKPSDLDGRVAGVSEHHQSEASESLKKLSENKPTPKTNEASATKKLLNKAFDTQKNLVLKIQNKLIELVF